ncbi:toprim domain-containing protein, partial [Desulfomicrobium escambiense]|uniref:toprim domain-containing protein n=1 Tax=Desulfomicrobium escambiense TaxID=29503 RepID=UPI001B7FED4A
MIDLNGYGPQGKLADVPLVLGDAVEKFRAAMDAEGYGSPDIEADGVLHRFDLPDDKAGAKSGWYILYSDGIPAGCFGNWREGSSIPWCSKKPYEMTKEENEEHERRIARAKTERETKQAEAWAMAARKYWDTYQQLPLAPADHSYLVKKKVPPMEGVRIARSGRLAVPLRDAENTFQGVQWIDGDGKKRFGSDVKTKGNFYLIPGDMSTVFVCEGYATGASIAMATGQAVVVAFNAGNLSAATASAKVACPGSKLVIAADDDRWTKNTKG